MAKKLYGLLVGINDYPSPVPKLRGCVNDIEAFAEYLQARADEETFGKPDLLILKDSDATREAVIKGFQKHLSKAGKDDVALFYYSGHGAQAKTAKEFLHLEPDKLDETLVCYDSRESGNYDLADKELAHLIAEVAKKDPHITVILDCCHSGSGTRGPLEMSKGTRVRLAQTDMRERPLESYLFDTKNLKAVDSGESGWFTLPVGRHVLLAACQPSELAKETSGDDDKQQGAFSYGLRKTLETANQPLTYLDLRERASLRVRDRVSNQLPLLETSPGNQDAIRKTFLGGATAKSVQYLASFDKAAKTWTLNAGTLHGIPKPNKDETTTLALFPEDAKADELRNPDKALAEASVKKVSAQTSLLELSKDAAKKLDEGKLYQAVIVDIPLAKLSMKFEGVKKGIEAARKALATVSDGKPSLFVAEEENPEYRLIAEEGGYTVARAADDRPLLEKISKPKLEEAAKEAIGQLEHIARWKATSLLENPDTKISPDAIKMIVRYDKKTLEDESFTLSYKANGDNPTFYMELENTTSKKLYCAVLALFESYQVLPVFQDWLEPGATFKLNDGEPIDTSVPDDLWEIGITERKDIFKLIVSKEPFDAHRLQQGKLEEYKGQRGLEDTKDIKRGTGTLERLMDKVTTRESFGGKSSNYDDWAAKTITLTTVRPKGGKPVASGGRGVELNTGVTLEPHPNLKATAKLSTITQLSRDLSGTNYSNFVVPEILRQDTLISQPLQFTTARGQDPGLSVLELEVENYEAVTSKEPLKLTLDMPLEEGEFILPLAFDGEHYLPLGYSKAFGSETRDVSAKTQIIIERLPNPDLKTIEGTPNARSLFGSLKILFQKLKSDWLGTKFEYPILAAVTVPDDAQVSFDKCYEMDIEKVKAKVKDAKRVLLYVHGIIGDTLGLVVSAQLAKVKQGDTEVPLKNNYDLILAFDYENLKTPIEDNARGLKKRLEEVGLGEGHGKTLHVVAHSMGGLVSRWFIEREGGNKIVERLVMLGTPNAGSPWPSVEDWATGMLTVGLNGLSSSHWTTAVIAKLGGILGAALEHVDVALDQMNAKSKFLGELSKSQDPGIPYSIIAGNTSLLEADNLLQKLKLKGYEALTKFLFSEPNDMAVGVSSVNSVEGGRNPKPITGEAVASDHVSYFRIKDSLEKLSNHLTK
jgi:Caspase domain/Lecithin:cholesterol acyltransferase